MPNNPQQLNTADDFSEFDFDADDVLIKDGDEVVSRNQEIKKSRNQEIKPVDLKIQSEGKSLTANRFKAEPPLELKKLNINSKSDIKHLREDLIKQANLQKENMETLSREGEGLFYDEKDDDEIEKFKKNIALKSNINIDLLVRKLISQIDIVSTLKIDLINRLKNIIASFLRDIRTASATEELLQRSIDSGGLNLPPEKARQIMDFVNNEHKKIHSAGFATKDDNAFLPKEKEYFEKSLKLLKFPQVELLKAGETGKKNVQNMSAEILSDKNVNLRANDNFKTQPKVGNGKDLKQQKKELNIPANLRVPEIPAPKIFKNLPAGVAAEQMPKAELPEQKSSAKRDISFQDFKIDEVLESINEELVQDKTNRENQNKKASWFSRLFKRKTAQSSKFKIQSSKSEKTKTGGVQNSKLMNQKGNELKVSSLEKKEMQRSQPVVRRVVKKQADFDNRSKMEDVKIVHPHLVGPIEELSEMTLVDFRRLGSTSQDSIDKIKEKIGVFAQELFSQKISAIQAWRKSQPNQLYIELGRQSLLKKLSVEDLIEQYNLENKPILTKEEFDLISQLNKELRY